MAKKLTISNFDRSRYFHLAVKSASGQIRTWQGEEAIEVVPGDTVFAVFNQSSTESKTFSQLFNNGIRCKDLNIRGGELQARIKIEEPAELTVIPSSREVGTNENIFQADSVVENPATMTDETTGSPQDPVSGGSGEALSSENDLV